MAEGVEQSLLSVVPRDRISGIVNVSADCVRDLQCIRLHAARPAGHNEPTQAGIDGSLEILQLVSRLSADDVCIVLISGGGSALLPCPREGITLADKQQLTHLMMQSGATINELNCVRRKLSRIKGGGLARACRAGKTISLIISDVIGDPLDTIASGPTVPDASSTAEARAVFNRFTASAADVSSAVRQILEFPDDAQTTAADDCFSTVTNHVIGNNAVALNAASTKAVELGYEVLSLGSNNEGEARDVGRDLARRALSTRESRPATARPLCLLSGGEPVVHLAKTRQPRKGGRNQEVVLAALDELWNDGMDGLAILSGGTDGEDGPTDAAGAVCDAEILVAARDQQLNVADYLAINNSYAFFERTGGLLRTGPTHTNVMDLRVALALPR